MARSKGCTIALIILAALILIVVVIGVLIWINKDKLIEAGTNVLIDTAEKAVVKNLPDGYTPEAVNQIMSDLKVAIKNDEIEGETLQKLVTTFQASMEDKEIDKEEGRRLLVMIQEALGQEPPPVEELPEEELPDTLQAVPDSA